MLNFNSKWDIPRTFHRLKKFLLYSALAFFPIFLLRNRQTSPSEIGAEPTVGNFQVSTSEVYFHDNFDRSYEIFTRNFRVHAYDVHLYSPKIQEIYERIENLERQDPSLPSHWHVSRKRNSLLPISSEKQYALEFWLSKWIRQSPFFTNALENATAFFIEIQCASLKNTQLKRLPAQRVAQLYVKVLIQNLAKNMPFYVNRMNYLDHFYSCSHDMGVECIRNTPLEFRSHAIGVVHTADFYGEDADRAPWNRYKDVKPEGQGGLIFNAHRDITAPPYILARKQDVPLKSFSNCKYLAMFLGSVSGRETRRKIFSLLSNRTDFLIGQEYGEEYDQAFQQSKFCLVVRGLVTSTLRFSEIFVHACIPVIISDGYIPPFSSSINWNTFSLFVPEKDVALLPDILGSIREERWNYMDANLRRVRKHFLYNNPPAPGDAFHLILYEVWKKVSVLRRNVWNTHL